MSRARRISVWMVFLAAVFQVSEVPAGAAAERREIQWPAPGLRDLQAAIDLAPDGGIVRIKPGTYEIAQPLFVRGKRLTLAGAGSGIRNGKRVTQLVGPPPQPVVNERGDIILAGDAVQGLWNFIGASVVVQDMRLSGFDAAIVTRADDARRAGPTTVDDVVIAQTGRGILSLSPAALKVTNTMIVETQWHAISVAPKFTTAVLLGNFSASGDSIIHPGGAGIYFDHAVADINHVTITGAKTGGIVGVSSWSSITNSTLMGNGQGGIVLETGITFITGNHISLSVPLQPESTFGDGIILASKDAQHLLTATLSKNFILVSSRAGVFAFGAEATLSNNQIMCSMFPLAGEENDGLAFNFVDDGGNQCGCGSLITCQVASPGIQAPTPIGGSE